MGSDEGQDDGPIQGSAGGGRDRLAGLRRAAMRVDGGAGLLAAARGLRRRLPRDERFGARWLGVDVNIAARVADAAKADQVLVSEVALSRVDLDALTVGRLRRLKAQGAPRGLRIVEVSRYPGTTSHAR